MIYTAVNNKDYYGYIFRMEYGVVLGVRIQFLQLCRCEVDANFISYFLKGSRSSSLHCKFIMN